MFSTTYIAFIMPIMPITESSLIKSGNCGPVIHLCLLIDQIKDVGSVKAVARSKGLKLGPTAIKSSLSVLIKLPPIIQI